jgi:hypothetical protein
MVALVVTRDSCKRVVAVLANTSRGNPDLWAFTLVHPLDLDGEIRATQFADRHSVGIGDRDDDRHRIPVACGGDALACFRRR